MILMTMIARVADALPLAASIQEDEQVRKTILQNFYVKLKSGHFHISFMKVLSKNYRDFAAILREIILVNREIQKSDIFTTFYKKSCFVTFSCKIQVSQFYDKNFVKSMF